MEENKNNIDIIYLKCFKCKVKYDKPIAFKELAKKNVYFSWSIKYCDKCRKEKENMVLNILPNILKTLSEDLKTGT